MTQDEIGQAVDVSRATVANVVAEGRRPEALPSLFQQSVAAFERDVQEAALPLVYSNPHLTPMLLWRMLRRDRPDLAARLPNPWTVRRILEKVLPYKLGTRRPPLNEAQRRARLLFALNFPFDQIRNYVWTDEMSIWKGRNDRAWDVPGAHYDHQRVGQPQKWMVWGGFSLRWGRLPLVQWQRGTHVDGPTYAEDVLRKVIFPWYDSLPADERRDVILVQDGAGPHWTPQCRAMLQAKGIRVEVWPANSPDLNMIEVLWAEIKSYVNSCPADVSVTEAVRLGWAAATEPAHLERVLERWLPNFDAVIENEGDNKHVTA